MADESSNDGLLEGVFQMPEHARITEKKFQPWHLPRKHWLRIHQWCAETGRLLREIRRQHGVEDLRYFSLPGDDLLDIRTLHGVCERERVPLVALGLNSGLNSPSVQAETNLSLNEVRSLEWVSSESTVLPDRLEHVANSRSLAYRRMKEYGPFDVVNLDLCDSFASAEPGEEGSYYSALSKIIDLQLNRRAPWLLFLTTRADKGAVNASTMKRLMRSVDDNITESEEFGAYLVEKMAIAPEDVKAAMDHEDGWPGERFHSGFGLGFAKWLLRLGAGAEPPTDIELVNCSGYRVYGGGEVDMLSLVFRVEAQFSGGSDPYGVVPENEGGDESPGHERESLGKRVVDGMADLLDVDRYLQSDGNVREKAKRQMKQILTDARYPVDQYDTWEINRMEAVQCA